MSQSPPEPRWLTPEERAAWLALLSTTTLLPGALDAPLLRAAKLSLFDYNVLAMLSESGDGTLPMSELAARTSASLSRLSHVVSKLQRRELLERRVAASDARVTATSITPAGLALIASLAPEHVRVVRELIFDRLDARDVADPGQIGRKLVRGLNPEHWILRTPAP